MSAWRRRLHRWTPLHTASQHWSGSNVTGCCRLRPGNHPEFGRIPSFAHPCRTVAKRSGHLAHVQVPDNRLARRIKVGIGGSRRLKTGNSYRGCPLLSWKLSFLFWPISASPLQRGPGGVLRTSRGAFHIRYCRSARRTLLDTLFLRAASSSGALSSGLEVLEARGSASC